jgi:hypothetical protein
MDTICQIEWSRSLEYATKESASCNKRETDMIKVASYVIPKFYEIWKGGKRFVFGVKATREDRVLRLMAQTFYHHVLGSIADSPVLSETTGFSLYRTVSKNVRKSDDQFSSFRELVNLIAYPPANAPFSQPVCTAWKSKLNVPPMVDRSRISITKNSI